MRIGHFAPNISDPGGISTYIRRLGSAQSRRGDTVFYLSMEDASTYGEADLTQVENESSLFEQAAELKLDILHLHKSIQNTPLLSGPIPVVRTMHGHQGSCPSGTRYLSRSETACDRSYHPIGCTWGHLVDRCGRRHPASILKHMRRIQREKTQAATVPTMTVSQFVRDKMIDSGCPSDRLQVVHSPAPEDIDAQEMIEDASPRMLFLGRIVPQKGIAWVLRALAEIDIPLHVDIAGDGHSLENMRTLAETHGVADRVTFHGWVEPETVSQLLASARAVLFPSIWHEPAGLVTLEAAAAGRPVIASTAGGIPEYAHSDFSIHVEPNDTPGLAHAMRSLAQDFPRARRMGRRGLKHARTTFSMDRFLDDVDAVYATVLPEPVNT